MKVEQRLKSFNFIDTRLGFPGDIRSNNIFMFSLSENRNVQILDVAVGISHNTNTFRKGMHPTISCE